jgi:hypothetical protein
MKKETIQQGDIVTDIILNRADASGSTSAKRCSPTLNREYFRSLLDHRQEIVDLAIADFKARFPNSPLEPDSTMSDVYSGDTVLLNTNCDDVDASAVATYHLTINRTDIPGRVELQLVSDDRSVNAGLEA